ncbi:unnamed protein product, partial [Symbiodinium sp. CCMP2456]
VKNADVTALPNETLVEALVPGVWGPLIDQFFQVPQGLGVGTSHFSVYLGQFSKTYVTSSS